MNMIITQDESAGFSYMVYEDERNSQYGNANPRVSDLIYNMIACFNCKVKMLDGTVYEVTTNRKSSPFEVEQKLGEEWALLFKKFISDYTTTVTEGLITPSEIPKLSYSPHSWVLTDSNLDRFIEDFSLKIGTLFSSKKFNRIMSWKPFGIWADTLEPLFVHSSMCLEQDLTIDEFDKDVFFSLFELVFVNCSRTIVEDCEDSILYIKSITVYPYSVHDTSTMSVKAMARVAIEYYAKKDSPETQRRKWLKAECGRGRDPNAQPKMSPMEINVYMNDSWEEMQSKGGTGSLSPYPLGYKQGT